MIHDTTCETMISLPLTDPTKGSNFNGKFTKISVRFFFLSAVVGGILAHGIPRKSGWSAFFSVITFCFRCTLGDSLLSSPL